MLPYRALVAVDLARLHDADVRKLHKAELYWDKPWFDILSHEAHSSCMEVEMAGKSRFQGEDKMATVFEDGHAKAVSDGDAKPCGIMEMFSTIGAMLAIIVVPALIGIVGLKLLALALDLMGLKGILTF